MKTESKALSTKAKKTIRARFGVEPLERRTLFAAVSWIATTSGDFSNPANWSGGQVPGVNDDVTINNPAIHVTINNEVESVKSLITNASIDMTNSDPMNGSNQTNLHLGNETSPGGGVTLEAGATIMLNNSGLVFWGTQMLSGDGAVQFSTGTITAVDENGASGSAANPGATLTIGSGVTIQGGSGTIAPFEYAGHYISIVIQGNVIADTAGGTITLNGDPSGTIVTGAIEATAGEVSLDPGTNATGPLIVSGTGTLDLNGGCSTSCLANLTRDGGTLNVAGFTDSGPISLDSATGSLNLTGMLNGNTVTSADGAQLICAGGAALHDVTLGAGSPIDLATNSVSLNVLGDLTLTDTTINLGAGSINFQGADGYAPPDYQSPLPQIIGGSGTITMGNGSSISVVPPEVAPTTLQISPNITINGGGGTIAILQDDNLTQTLINQGTISADTPGGAITIVPNNGTFTNAGTLSASNGGTLAIQGDFALDGDATTNIGIGASGTGTLAISGAATLAGTLNVSLADGFVPPGNQTYNLLTYGSETGNFSAVNLPTTDGTDTTTLGATTFTLATPPPTIAQLTAIVADDRMSLAQSKSQRHTTLHNLLLTRNKQQKSLALARRSLAALIRENRRNPNDTLATEIAAQTSQVTTQSQALMQTRQNLSTDIRTDFTEVHPAMKKLLADSRSLHQATQHARRGKSALRVGGFA